MTTLLKCKNGGEDIPLDTITIYIDAAVAYELEPPREGEPKAIAHPRGVSEFQNVEVTHLKRNLKGLWMPCDCLSISELEEAVDIEYGGEGWLN